MYRRVGCNVRTVLMDGEFEKLEDIMPTIECGCKGTCEQGQGFNQDSEGVDMGAD